MILVFLSQNPESTHVKTIQSSSLKWVLHLFEMKAPLHMHISFQVLEHSIEVGHAYFYVPCQTSTPLLMQCPFHNLCFCIPIQWISHCVFKHIKYVLQIFWMQNVMLLQNKISCQNYTFDVGSSSHFLGFEECAAHFLVI